MGKKFRNKDLAARLGVSGTLVSLVLNNKADQQGIRKDTQEKVLSLAKQMGYFETLHNRKEISPTEERPGIIGMIVPSLHDPNVIQLAPYLQKAFSSIGVGFSIVTKDPDDQRFERMVGAFKKFFSGLILFGEAADDSTIRTLKSTEYPFMLLDKTVNNQRLNTVSTDFVAGAKLVADHIEHLMYKNVVIVDDKNNIHTDYIAIQSLIGEFDKKPGINPPLVINLERSEVADDIDFNQLEKLLRPPYRADVIISAKAKMTYQLMAFLRKKKLRIPQDISVISMEDDTGFDLMYTPVTALQRPVSVISAKVANMIWLEVKNVGKGKFKRQVNIPPQLTIRNSCGTI